jgi:hypothetical protein
VDGALARRPRGPRPRRAIYALLPDAGARETERVFLAELERAL